MSVVDRILTSQTPEELLETLKRWRKAHVNRKLMVSIPEVVNYINSLYMVMGLFKERFVELDTPPYLVEEINKHLNEMLDLVDKLKKRIGIDD